MTTESSKKIGIFPHLKQDESKRDSCMNIERCGTSDSRRSANLDTISF